MIDIDASRTGGLLELRLSERQQDRHQHPAAAARALAGGAVAAAFTSSSSGGRWLDGRDGGEFFAALSACASAQAGQALRFEP